MSNETNWDKRYEELCQFILDNDRLPGTYDTLRHWVAKQRIKYRKNKLTVDKIDKLESLHYWLWEPNASKWEVNYLLFSKIIESDGLIELEKNQKKYLLYWISKQENLRVEGLLEKWHLNLLEKIDFWNVKDKIVFWNAEDKLVLIEENWITNYKKLKIIINKLDNFYWDLKTDTKT